VQAIYRSAWTNAYILSSTITRKNRKIGRKLLHLISRFHCSICSSAISQTKKGNQANPRTAVKTQESHPSVKSTSNLFLRSICLRLPKDDIPCLPLPIFFRCPTFSKKTCATVVGVRDPVPTQTVAALYERRF